MGEECYALASRSALARGGGGKRGEYASLGPVEDAARPQAGPRRGGRARPLDEEGAGDLVQPADDLALLGVEFGRDLEHGAQVGLVGEEDVGAGLVDDAPGLDIMAALSSGPQRTGWGDGAGLALAASIAANSSAVQPVARGSIEGAVGAGVLMRPS